MQKHGKGMFLFYVRLSKIREEVHHQLYCFTPSAWKKGFHPAFLLYYDRRPDFFSESTTANVTFSIWRLTSVSSWLVPAALSATSSFIILSRSSLTGLVKMISCNATLVSPVYLCFSIAETFSMIQPKHPSISCSYFSSSSSAPS